MKKASLSELLALVERILEDHRVPHALIGGLAIGVRGYPRSTVDIDFLVNGESREEVRALLTDAGFECHAETEETLHFGGLGALDILLARRSPSLAMLERATRLEGLDVPVLQVEDIIGLKIQAYHNEPSRKWKDQADIAELIRANPNLDWSRVLSHAAAFNAQAELEAIRSGVRQ